VFPSFHCRGKSQATCALALHFIVLFMCSRDVTILRNERRHQAKYDEDESTLSEESSLEELIKCKFQRLDFNRQKRKSVLMRPIDMNSEHKADTARRFVFFYSVRYLMA